MRLIDADVFHSILSDALNKPGVTSPIIRSLVRTIIYSLDAMPTVDAVPVVHATLEDIGIVEDDREWVCSNCKAEFTVCVCGKDRTRYIQYCPYCGAMIIGERKGGDE